MYNRTILIVFKRFMTLTTSVPNLSCKCIWCWFSTYQEQYEVYLRRHALFSVNQELDVWFSLHYMYVCVFQN
jgi:hypothetical protein